MGESEGRWLGRKTRKQLESYGRTKERKKGVGYNNRRKGKTDKMRDTDRTKERN